MKTKQGRPINYEIKIKILQLQESGFSYPKIAKILGLKSRQIARYHAGRVPLLTKKRKHNKIKLTKKRSQKIIKIN